MTQSLKQLIGRDLAALRTDLARLSNGIELLQMAHAGGIGRFVEIAAVAAQAEGDARRIRDRLHEVGLQAQSAERRA